MLQERWQLPGAEDALPSKAAGSQTAQAVHVHAKAAQHAALQPDVEPARKAVEQNVKRWLPFSMGTRDCVGQNLARMNYITTVAMLLACFSFHLHDKVCACGMRPRLLSGTQCCSALTGNRCISMSHQSYVCSHVLVSTAMLECTSL